MTTFNEKASAKNSFTTRPPPHELRKFQDLRILDIAAGLYHILLFAVSKTSPSNSLDITSSDPNENIPVYTWPESDTSIKSSVDQKRVIETKHTQLIPEFKNIISPKPVLARDTLQAIQTSENSLQSFKETIATKVEIQPVNQENNSPIDDTTVSRQANSPELIKSAIETEVPIELPPQPQIQSVEKEIEILEGQPTVKKQNETMDMLTKNVSNIGDSLMTDIKSIATTGEGMLNDLAKETEKTIKEVPKNVIDYVKSSIGSENGTEHDENVMEMDKVKESVAKEMPKDIINDATSPPMQQTATDLNNLNENEQIKHNNKLNRALAADDSNETVVDDIVNNEVKFINNGIDVSSSSDIIQAMNDEIHEMSNDAKSKADELTMKYDGIVNDEITAAKETASAKIFEIKNGNQWNISFAMHF